LRKIGASPRPPQPRANWRSRLLDRYADYLVSERGIATDTIAIRVRVARALLSRRDRARSVRRVRVADLRRFFRHHIRGLSSPSAAIVATALRSFLRYLHVVGEVDSSLVYAVPPIAGWRLARLPRGVSEQTVKRLLRSCNRRTMAGLRDYAILMLLVRLGLRRCEVARLMLEDVDWRDGNLVVRGKGRSIARLPLPADVGAALAAYAKRRGSSPSRALFLRARAPAGPLGAPAVGAIVQNAARRAGAEGVSAHRLRHTVATQMLRNGGTLAEIAEVLRHKNTVTTAIYAKVDRAALRELAQPWPRGAL
jgi:integrase/recombinase XerD